MLIFFKVQEHVLDVGDRMRLLSNLFVELLEIIDEAHGSIFLANDKGMHSPFRAINPLQNANFAKAFCFIHGWIHSQFIKWTISGLLVDELSTHLKLEWSVCSRQMLVAEPLLRRQQSKL